MRSLLAPARLLLPWMLVSSLGCGSAEHDPDAATKAAKSAAGAVGDLATKDDPVDPAIRTATCIVDDGDNDTSDPERNDQKGPKDVKPQLDPSPKGPEVGVVEPVGVQTAAPPPPDGGTARSAKPPLDPTKVPKTCKTRMAAKCSTFCSQRKLEWIKAAGNDGTCHVIPDKKVLVEGDAKCGCMCK